MSVCTPYVCAYVCVCGKSTWADTSFARDGACVLYTSGLQSADMQPAHRLGCCKLQRKTKGLNRPRYICMHKDSVNDSASTSLSLFSRFEKASLFQVIPLVIEL